MPTPKKGPRLASSPAHERLMLANMATSLFQNGRITTTLPKAKRLRPLAERLITFAKRGDLHSRRRVMRVIRNKSVVHILFTQIAEQMEQREVKCGKEKAKIFKFPAQWYFFLFTLSWILGILMKYLCINCIF